MATSWHDHLRADWESAGERFWKGVVDPVARVWEKRFKQEARGQFGDEFDAIRAALRKKAVPDWTETGTKIKDVLESRKGDWRSGFIPLYQGLMDEFADDWSVELGVDFGLVRQQVLDFVDQYAFQFVNKHQGVTRDAVAALVAQAHSEGWSILGFMDALQSLYDGWDTLRAEMIARSETIRSENAGSVAAYQAAGVAQVQWWTALDERVCSFCGEIHGRTWPTGDPLFQKGDVMTAGDQRLNLNYEDVVHPPLHVFCRCTVLPVVG
jgi:hypothetical protein